MNKRKHFLLIYILGVLSISVPLAASDSPDVKELLRRFAEARENFTSFIFECEATNTFNYPQHNWNGKRYSKLECRFDGNRGRTRVFWWGNVDIRSPNVSKDQAHYSSELWDGENRYWYNRTAPSDLGLVQIRRIRDPGGVPKEQTDIIKGKNIVGEMMGYHWGDNGKRVDEILDIAEYLELRKNKKKLRGVDCYVIDAVVKGKGKYKLWIDPIHDYHIAKIHVWRKEGDYVHTRMAKKNQSTNEMFEILRFQKIGDSWFPLEYKMERTIIDNGRLSKENKTTNITNIVLNPDHDALKSFIPDDIPNGATANIVAFPSSLEFIWQDGKVVDKTGRVIMDSKTKKPAGSTSEPKSKSQTKKHPTALELIDKYTQALDSTSSFIADYEKTTEGSFRGGRVSHAGKYFSRGQLRYDNQQLYEYEYRWGDWASMTFTEDKPHYTIAVVNSEMNYQNTKRVGDRPGKAMRRPRPQGQNITLHAHFGVSYLAGYIGSDERLDAILRKADRIGVQKKTQKVGDSDCFVIEADTKHGRYKVWLDPEHGFHPAKLLYEAGEGDYSDRHLMAKGDSAKQYLKNVRFEKVGDVWVPMEADSGCDLRVAQGDFVKDNYHYKRTKIVLNPDHNKLGSFDDPLENPSNDPELKNGTRIRMEGGLRGVWLNGKVVDKNGRVIADFRIFWQ